MLNNIAELEYEAAQAEKRDKMNARLQVWSLFIGLVGGFGLVSAQSGTVSYVVALFPFLAACIARYAAHSEMVLDRVKAYLLSVEQANGYQGYEAFNQACKNRRSSGGHKAALRDALVLTELLATAVVVVRLLADHLPVLAVIGLAVVELLAIVATIWFLKERTK